MIITEYLIGLIKALQEHNAVVLMANTSVGKSLGLPAAIASVGTKIFVSVPTRVNAITLYYTSLEILRELNLQFSIGYAAEGERHYDNDTMLVYATSGHIRKKMLSSFQGGHSSPILWADVLFVDEVHIGSIDNTIIIELWKKVASDGLQVPRLLMASATVPDEIFLNMHIPDIFPYRIEAKNFPIEIMYHNKSFGTLRGSKDLLDAIVSVSQKLLFEDDRTKNLTGNMLIFLPGGPEVEDVTSKIRFEISKREALDMNAGIVYDVLPAYSSLTREELDLVSDPEIPGHRKIIVATNIVETGVTLNDLDMVIDSMIEKRLERTQSGGTRLSAHLISKSSAKQRSGRVGRLRKGFCYRMITEKDFNDLEDQRPPDIQRLPIEPTILELFSISLEPEEILTDVGVPRKNVKQAIQSLLDDEFLIVDPKGLNVVTPAGLFATELTLGIRNSKVIFDYLHNNNYVNALSPKGDRAHSSNEESTKNIFQVIALMTFVDSSGAQSFFYTPKQMSDESDIEYDIRVENHVKTFFDKFRGLSDLDTFINLWNFIVTGGPQAIDEQNQWPLGKDIIKRISVQNSLNNKLLTETLKTIEKTAQVIRRNGFTVPVQLEAIKNDDLLLMLNPILESVFWDSIGVSSGKDYFTSSGMMYKLNSRSLNNLNPKVDKRIVALLKNEVNPTRSYVSVAGKLPDVLQKLTTKERKKKEQRGQISLSELDALIS